MRFTKLKELQMRLDKNTEVELNGESPHIEHIQECLEVIEDVEANHKGLSDEKFLNNNEKYKIALCYMDMLENPKKY